MFKPVFILAMSKSTGGYAVDHICIYTWLFANTQSYISFIVNRKNWFKLIFHKIKSSYPEKINLHKNFHKQHNIAS